MTIKMLNGERVYNDYFNIVAMHNYAGWSNGTAVTENTVPDMSVLVASGEVKIGNTVATVSPQNPGIATSDPTYDRFDLILVDATGTVSVATGTPAVNPKPVDTWNPETHVVIARVRVPSGATSILNADIKDLRSPVGGAGGGAASVLFGAPQSGCSNGNAVRFNGTNFVPAQADTISNAKVVGFINNVSGGTGDVYLFGEIDFLSGLTAGSTYYLSGTTPGAVTSTRPGVPIKVGIATSTTTLLVDIDPEVGNGGGRYTQAFTGTSITVTHNLGDSLPIVQVYDSLGEQITPDTIDITDANNVQLTFSISTSGNVIVTSVNPSITPSFGTSSTYSMVFTSSTSVIVPHNLNSQYVVVQVYDNSNQLVEPLLVTLDNSNQCTVTFGVSTSGRVVVVGGSTFNSVGGAGSIIPTLHNAYDLGSNSNRWANVYVGSGGVTASGNSSFGGDLGVTGSTTFGNNVTTPSGLDSIKGGFGRFRIADFAGNVLSSPPGQAYVGNYPAAAFDASTQENLFFEWQVPVDLDPSQDVVFEIVHSTQSANTSASIVLGLEVNAIGAAGDLTPVSPASTTQETISVYDTAEQAKFNTTSTVKIPSSILAANRVIGGKLYRKTSDGADTANGDWYLIDVVVKYKRL
jgi:hypothetical protein